LLNLTYQQTFSQK